VHPYLQGVNGNGAQKRPAIAERRFSSGLGSITGTGSGSGMGIEAKEDVVPVGFDEGVLRALCESDVSTGVV
jgi:hypothetical protein